MTLPKLHLTERWDAAYQSAALDAYEAAYHDNLPIPSAVPLLGVLIYLLTTLWHDLVCGVRGHVLEVESDIGCDSGSEYFSCSRCGWSHTVTYY